MSKLFHISAIKKEYFFIFETYQKNRIASKIIRKIKEDKKYIISVSESLTESRIFEIRIFSGDYKSNVIHNLKKDIYKAIKASFPNNYLFDFGDRRLGFTNSFKVYLHDDCFCFECYHRIKEIRRDGSSIMPNVNEQIKG